MPHFRLLSRPLGASAPRANFALSIASLLIAASALQAQDLSTSLDASLKQQEIAALADQVRKQGNPRRGALLFFTSAASCSKCHAAGENQTPGQTLGPDLAALGSEATVEHLIESILYPSRKIRTGYATVSVQISGGKLVTGLQVADDPDALTLRDAAHPQETMVIDRSDVEQFAVSKTSMMPDGIVGSLQSERQFFDLVGYVAEIARGGPQRAAQLKPGVNALATADDSKNLDHAGILRALGANDLAAGRTIYLGHCKNCHGINGTSPSMPMARAFSLQKLKFGADPYQMFLTLSRGNGLMAPMSHLSPKERYQVVHYVREVLMKPSNPEYLPIDDAYLEQLPQGTGTGEFRISGDRDYGPVLASQLGQEVNRALSFRLPHQVTVCYDLHRMRLGGVWQGGFLDLSETHHYRQRGEKVPQPLGVEIPGLANWKWRLGGSFEIPEHAKPPRGPVRKDWLQYHGHYLYAEQAILSYAIHGREILEMIHANATGELQTVEHTLRIDSGDADLQLCVGKMGAAGSRAGLVRWGETETSQRQGNVGDSIAMVANTTGDGDDHIAAAAIGDVDGLTWRIDDANRIVLTIPASVAPRVVQIVRSHGVGAEHLQQLAAHVAAARDNLPLTDPLDMTRGGPSRWPEELAAAGKLGSSVGGYALDTIALPFDNPWNAWPRTSALDFLSDGRAVVATHGGDVYIVSGLDGQLGGVTWRRFAAGLFEPFGVRVAGDQIYVTCRDGIVRLHDYDDNGEADFVESFWTDDDLSSVFHAFNFDLQTDSAGNFYFAKAGGHTDHGRPGTIMRIPPAGGEAEVVAWGLRTPNGMGKLRGDRFTVSDNQGPWIPAGKISLIRNNTFLGFMPINQQQQRWLRERSGGALPDTFEEPILWLPQDLDNSCGGQLWVDDPRWGPLSGRLIHSSYGKGWLYYLSLQEVAGQTQGSIVRLPHQWDAGVMRLRVNPRDGQVYGVGLSGWQGPPGGMDGCLQRLRYTGEPTRIVEKVRVTSSGIELALNFSVDPKTAGSTSAYTAEMWNYLWSEKYGSDQFSVMEPGKKGRDSLPVQSVDLTRDLRTIRLEVPELTVCDQLLLKLRFKDATDVDFAEKVYLTVHAVPDPENN